MSETADRYAELRAVARAGGLDAVALVPGPNFERLFDKDFHTSERPLVVLIPPAGPPAAVVPNLELGSFALIGFEGAVFDWRDQDGYGDAFAALAAAMPLARIGVEGQVMRVFVHHALASAVCRASRSSMPSGRSRGCGCARPRPRSRRSKPPSPSPRPRSRARSRRCGSA
jgi:hypothetical protein